MMFGSLFSVSFGNQLSGLTDQIKVRVGVSLRSITYRLGLLSAEPLTLHAGRLAVARREICW